MKRRFKFQQCACFHICISFYGHDCILTVSSTGAVFVPPIRSTIINRDEKKHDLSFVYRNEKRFAYMQKKRMKKKKRNGFEIIQRIYFVLFANNKNDHRRS